MPKNNKCNKCEINPQSGERGQEGWNICSDCITPSLVYCGWCSKVKRTTNEDGKVWVDQLSKEWHKDVKNHKSTCPTSFCSGVCEKEWQENEDLTRNKNKNKASTSKEFLEKDEVNLKKSIEEHEREMDKLQKDMEFSLKMQPLEDEYQRSMLSLAFDKFSDVASEEEVQEFVVKSRTHSNASTVSIRTKAGYELRLTRMEDENKIIISKLEEVQEQNQELKEQVVNITGMLQQILSNQLRAQQEQSPK